MNAPSHSFPPTLRLRPDLAGEKGCGVTGVRSRELGPDLVRCLACVLVVILHASVPYLTHPMPGLFWLVQDDPSATIDLLFWGIEVLVMPLFLLLSGFYAWSVLQKDCSRRFLTSRIKRLLRPFLLGVLVILPIDLYLWTFGLVVQGQVPLIKLKSFKLPSPWGDQLWGTSHLWYLLYVFLYATVLWFGYRTTKTLFERTNPNWAMVTRMTVWFLQPARVVIALVTTAIFTLAVAPEVVYGFQHAFMPVPSKWVYSGTFFAGGTLLAIVDSHWQRTKRAAAINMLLGTSGVIASVVLGTWRLQILSHSPSSQLSLAQWALAAITVFSAWTITLGIVGLAIRVADRLEQYQTPRSIWLQRKVQFFAAASIWVYLVHHPLVGIVQLDLYYLQVPLDASLKVVLATTVACVLGAITYGWWFHETRLGAQLGLSVVKPKPADTSELPVKLPMSPPALPQRLAA